MEKLELKHLAPYLPYQLKFINIIDGAKELLSGIDTYIEVNWEKPQYKDGTIIVYSFYDYCSMWSVDEIKPILRPLSDLTKEIEVNGIVFIPMHHENCFYIQHEYAIELIQNKKIELCFVENLLEWHFDVFGLIEKGLAIDINTL